MGKVFIDMAMSLDGFVAGPNNADAGLHDWYFAPEGSAPAVIDELLQSIGAMVLGRRTFGEQPEGFETPYEVVASSLQHSLYFGLYHTLNDNRPCAILCPGCATCAPRATYHAAAQCHHWLTCPAHCSKGDLYGR